MAQWTSSANLIQGAKESDRQLSWDGTTRRTRPQRWAVEERGRESLCPSGAWSEMGHREAQYWMVAQACSLEGLPLPAELLHRGGGWG